jgi:integrase
VASRAIHRLSDLKVKKAKHPGLYCDGGGLYLRIAEGGSKSWLFRYRVGPRLRDHGLGSLITVSLAEAREAALRCRKQRMEGVDPIAARQTERATARAAQAHVATFKACALAYMEVRAKKWRNGKSFEQWRQSLTDYVFPIIGDLPIGLVDTPQVMRVLKPIWDTKTETADRVRGRIEMILDYARVHGFRTGDNPARWRGHLEHLLHAQNKVKHHAALPYRDLPALTAKLRQRESAAARALEFLALTAARRDEVRLATWAEVDLAAKTWTVPAERMKINKEHRVPLSTRALAILGATPAAQRVGYLFPGRNGAIGVHAVLYLLQELAGSDVTVHGLRSTFRDWAAECTSFPSEVCEAALAHAIPSKVEASYKRTDFFDRRRELMEAWASYCAGPVSDKVVRLRGVS